MTRKQTARPRKRPRQARSKKTYGDILEAAARILETRGLEAANTNTIAEIAGVSVGSLYQYFPDKSAIFAELIRNSELETADGLEASLERTAGMPLEERLARLVRVGVHQQMARPQLARLLDYLEATLLEASALEATDNRIEKLILRFLREHADSIERPPTKTTARDAVSIVKGMVDGASFAGETGIHALEARVVMAVLGYLQRPQEP